VQEASPREGSDDVPLEPVRGRKWVVPGLGMEFVWIESLGCWVGKYEVTNAEYRNFRRHNSARYKEMGIDGERQPVAYVSLEDAQAFARWLSEREAVSNRLPLGWGYRLPTGDEWTTFAQCGDGRKYPWGEGWPPTEGNYSDASSTRMPSCRIADYDDGHPVSCPVEQSGENEWGLCGVGGNVWEWTTELYDEDLVVFRGGSWADFDPEGLLCSARSGDLPSEIINCVGFRLVIATTPVSPGAR